VPAAAVIPAPIAYAKFAAVKKLVVGFLVRCLWVAGRWVGVGWVSNPAHFTVQRNHPCVPEFRAPSREFESVPTILSGKWAILSLACGVRVAGRREGVLQPFRISYCEKIRVFKAGKIYLAFA